MAEVLVIEIVVEHHEPAGLRKLDREHERCARPRDDREIVTQEPRIDRGNLQPRPAGAERVRLPGSHVGVAEQRRRRVAGDGGYLPALEEPEAHDVGTIRLDEVVDAHPVVARRFIRQPIDGDVDLRVVAALPPVDVGPDAAHHDAAFIDDVRARR